MNIVNELNFWPQQKHLLGDLKVLSLRIRSLLKEASLHSVFLTRRSELAEPTSQG